MKMIEDYSLAINAHTSSVINAFISREYTSFDIYQQREADREVREWINDGGHGLALILGDAGLGKTSLLCTLAEKLIYQRQSAVIFIKSGDLLDGQFEENILAIPGLGSQGMNLADIFEDLSGAGKRTILMLDDLDVLTADENMAKLEKFISTYDRADLVILGTSRPFEYNKIGKLAVKNFEMRPFTYDEVGRYFVSYKSCHHMENEDFEFSQQAMDICRNPLYMRMLLELYAPKDIPNDISVVLLYDRYWQSKTGATRAAPLPLETPKKEIAAGLRNELSGRIAAEMYIAGKLDLDVERLEKIKAELAGDRVKSEQVVTGTGCEDTETSRANKDLTAEYSALFSNALENLLAGGLLIEREKGAINFSHRTLLEYAVAAYILEDEKENQGELLKGLLDNITFLKNRAIIQEVIIQARVRGENQISGRFMEKLTSYDTYTKMLAIDLLRQIDGLHEDEVGIYLGLARDTDLGVKIYLAESLTWILGWHPGLVRGLMDILRGDKDWTVRKEAVRVLPDMVKGMEPATALELIDTLRRDKDWAVRKELAEVLPSLIKVMKPGTALGLIEALIGDKDGEVRKGVAGVLPDLIRVKPNLSWEFVEALGRDKGGEVRKEVARVLPDSIRAMKPAPALGLIETLSRDRDSEVQKEMAKILPDLIELMEPDPALGLIETLSKDGDWNVRKEVVKLLPDLIRLVKPDPARRLIDKLSSDKDWAVRKEFTRVLPDLIIAMKPDLVPALVEALSRDKNDEVRREMAEVLPDLIKAMKPGAATGLLDALRVNKDSYIREAAAKLIPESN